MSQQDYKPTQRDVHNMERYAQNMHAVQSGIAALLGTPNYQDATPKHLRVGVECNFVNQDATARLLIEKGIFTHEEYFEAMAEASAREKALYEERVSKVLGRKVSLG